MYQKHIYQQILNFVYIKFQKMSIKTPQTIRMIQKCDRIGIEGKIQNYFACECGKKYETFPALYLHFKRVHKIKISTKVTQEDCIISTAKSSRVFKYYYSQIGIKNRNTQISGEEEIGSNNLLANILSQFAQDSGKFVLSSWKAQWLLDQLRKFLLSLKTCYEEFSVEKIVEEIPFHLNNFVIEKDTDLKEKNFYDEACQILLRLGKWLNKKNYSPYILVPYAENQSTSSE